MEIEIRHKKLIDVIKNGNDDYSHRNRFLSFVLKEFTVITENFHAKFNENFYNNVSKFLNNSYNLWLNVTENTHCREIMPIGLMLLGVNTPDHENTFNCLSKISNDIMNNDTVRLASRNCTTMKKTIEFIVKNVIPADELAACKLPRSLKYSLMALDEWYRNQNEQSVKQIVLIFEDVELFDVELLQNLIEVISTRRLTTPFVILMGLTSNLETFNGMLNNRCLSRISKHIFPSTSPSELLNALLEELMTNAFPFQLSSRMYSYIVSDMFMCLDYSISNLIFRYRYCLHEHIHHTPDLWSLLSLDNRPDTDITFADLCASPTVIDSRNCQRLFVNIAHWLLDIFSKFPETNLGKKLHQILSAQLKHGLGNSNALKLDLTLLKTLSPAEVTEAITKANTNLSTYKENNTLISDFIDKSQNFLRPSVAVDDQVKRNSSASLGNISRKELKERLLADNREKKKHSFLDDFSNWLLDWLKKNLPHYSASRSYKGLYFDNLDQFQENINPSIRRTLKKGLMNPHEYIQDKSLCLDSLESINASLPDTCIAYKLHLEYPRLINIYDWLIAFNQVIEKVDTDDKPPSLMTQCRFNNALAEMEFLGFIKRSRAKPDHVTKLTWGSLF